MASFNLSPVFQTPAFSSNGTLLAGGKLYWYLAATSTPVTVYQDYAGAAAHTQPIILDVRGEPPAPIWLPAGQAYKVVLQDSTGVQLQVIDQITGIGDSLVATQSFSYVIVNSTSNRAKIYQGASGDLEVSTNLDSGTQATFKFQSAGFVFPDSTSQATAGFTGFRNKLINGVMMVDQRNNGALLTQGASPIYCVDRWQIAGSQASKFTAQQQVAGSGMYYLALTSTAATSPGSSESYTLTQKVEGFNCNDLFFGTANAKTITLSFTVLSSQPGLYGGSIQNAAGTRSYPFSYYITTANTYTQIAITIPGDTAGTWLQTNGVGMQVIFDLGSGSTLRTTGGAWASGNYVAVTGCSTWCGVSGATFDISQVQLEKAPSATPFEYRPLSFELSLCQRYFQKLYGMQFSACGPYGGTFPSNMTSQSYPAPQMRSTPTVTQANNTYGNATALTLTPVNAAMVQSILTVSSAGNAYAQCDLSLSAEL